MQTSSAVLLKRSDVHVVQVAAVQVSTIQSSMQDGRHTAAGAGCRVTRVVTVARYLTQYVPYFCALMHSQFDRESVDYACVAIQPIC